MKRVLALIATTAILGLSAACSSAPATTYKAKVQDYNVINPADLGVVVRVTNTGQQSGTPTCMVTAQDPSYAYHGFDSGTLTKPIAAGASGVFAMNITITQQGAQYVTDVSVKCS